MACLTLLLRCTWVRPGRQIEVGHCLCSVKYKSAVLTYSHYPEDGYFTIHPSGVVQLVVVDSGSIATTYDVQVSEGADGGRVVKMTFA
jgi:hypothetical protein